MEEPVNAFDLSPEQQDTANLLQRLLGKAIADRYADFCRLAAGALALLTSRPMAAHVLRELDSMLRKILEVPMEVKTPQEPIAPETVEKVREGLKALDFDDAAIQRATDALKPRSNHKSQIQKIAPRLGLAPDGDVANCWTALCDSVGKAHQRSFHRSLEVDEEFRSQNQQPFDMVIRAVAIALQGRYVSLMRHVEDLTAMHDRAHVVKLFASEIPGALSLQRHFYQRLQTNDWLPHLAKRGMLGEPLLSPDAGGTGGT